MRIGSKKPGLVEPCVIREARQAMGLTQAELGKILGCSARVVSNIEGGDRPIKRGEAKKLEELVVEFGLGSLESIRSASYENSRPVISVVIQKKLPESGIQEALMAEVILLLETVRKVLPEGWSVEMRPL